VTGFGWVVIAIAALNLVVSIAWIGKKRDPIDPGTVLAQLAITTFTVVGVLAVGTGHL
jgi:hypothetical protein